MYRKIQPEEIKLDKTLGYLYFLDKEHPLATGVGKVYYHRHVASIANKRWLTTKEVVHHKDSNKLNNSLENLVVLSSSDHALLHREQDGHLTGLKELVCMSCNNKYTVTLKDSLSRKFCSKQCADKSSVQWNITKNELQILIWNISYTEISKKYPISDVGAKKRAKALGCKLPPPYFFNKSEKFRKEQRQLNGISDLPL